jgi:hypothetical protein
MTRNPTSDGENLLAPFLNGGANAPNLELVKSGCTPSKGTGDWDVDIASGTIIAGQSTGEVSVSATTKTLTAPGSDADLDSGKFRVDVISVDSTGTVNVAEGTAASKPISPDIPSGEVLLAAVVVDGSASSLSSSDINDYRVLYGPTAYPFDRADIVKTGVASSETDDGSDVTAYTGESSGSGSSTILDITGSGVLLSSVAVCDTNEGESMLGFTVDGGKQFTDPGSVGGGNAFVSIGPTISFDSSLTVDLLSITSTGATNKHEGMAWVKQ